MSDINMTSLADRLQDLELCLRRHPGKEISYGRALREAIFCSDTFTEVEVLKSLGDLHLQKAKLSKDSGEIDKAAGLYAAALLRCTDQDMGQTLEHRIGYMEKLSRQLLQGYTPHFLWLSPDYWGPADSNVLRVANVCDKSDRSRGISIEETYTELLVTAISNSDAFLEVEVLKSLGDFYLKRGRKTSDVSQFSKAATMYNKALTKCGDPGTKMTLKHRIRYTEKIREAVKKKPSLNKSGPKEGRLDTGFQLGNITRTDIIQDQNLNLDKKSQYQEHIKEGQSSLARVPVDLASAEKHFAAALKTVHVRDPTVQQYQREVEPLCKLGDVYSKRGQQTGDGGDFVKAAALYNAAIVRSKDEVLNGNIVTAIIEVEKSFLKCTLDICHNVSLENTEEHKKQLKEMRDQIKLEMDTIDQQLDPYVHDEDDPCVKEIEAKRAQAVRQLFEKIAQQRKEFISLLVEKCIGLMGPPPCKYALIGLGSQATGLVTPYSDLEFAILVEEESEECLEYFRNLTHYLHLKVVNLGETILPALGIKSLNDFYSKNPLDDWYYDSVTPRGFAFDGSMPKASKTPLGRQGTENNPPTELICTPENMVSILQSDATLYLKKGYHLATILRNPCLIAGDQDLIDTNMDITGKILQADGGKMAQQLAQETQGENIKINTSTETMITGRLMDVKKDLYRFPSVAVDCLALSSGIIPTTVWETIEEMEDQKVISPNNAHHLTVLTSISAELRLRTYIANGGQKENLSALDSMEMKTMLQGKEPSLETNDEDQTTALRAAFHLPSQKQLFRYYYTAVPLKNILSEWIREKPILSQLSDLYDASPRVQGLMYYELCKYKLAISYFDKANKAKRSDSDVKSQLLIYMGLACYRTADYQKAISYYEQFLQIERSLYGQTAAHPQIAILMNLLGAVWMCLGDYKKAISYHEEELRINECNYGHGTDHHEIALSLTNLGSAWDSLGEHGKAIKYSEQALQMFRNIYGKNTPHPDIAGALHSLGGAMRNLGDYRKAIGYSEQALEICRSIYGQSAAHPMIAMSLNNLGYAWVFLDNYRKAVSYYEQALEMYISIYGQGTAHPNVASPLINLGQAWCKLGDHRKAISYLEQALQMNRSIYGQGTDHPDIAISLTSIGTTWLDLGDNRKAINYFNNALKMFRSTYCQNKTNLPSLLNNMGYGWYKLDNNRMAISHYEQSLQMWRSIPGERHDDAGIAKILNNLGLAWKALGDCRKAMNYFEQALQMQKSIYGQSTAHPDIAISLTSIGTAWHHLGDQRKAISYLEQSLQMKQSIYGQITPDLATAASLNNLGHAWRSLGDIRKTINYHEQELQMFKSIYGQSTDHANIAASLNNLGAALYTNGDHKKAIVYLDQALQMHRSIYGESTAHPDMATTLNMLGAAWRELGDNRKAISYFEQGLKMRRSIYG
ncbi:uncharacterized protein [Branchiostoma lanceolatum]|uniref:uncharacterized protein n=1 Tax=Branchiostoma lanceolatum TaxID=7740 RepID=UPI0034524361